jgi:hypothetical protein
MRNTLDGKSDMERPQAVANVASQFPGNVIVSPFCFAVRR